MMVLAGGVLGAMSVGPGILRGYPCLHMGHSISGISGDLSSLVEESCPHRWTKRTGRPKNDPAVRPSSIPTERVAERSIHAM